jgi:hypothetical protein
VNNKRTILKIVLFLILVLIVVLSTYLSSVNKNITTTNKCSLRNNICTFTNEYVNLGVGFKHSPIVEEEIFIEFTLSPNFTISQSWIEGANMYMGKTPVITNATENGVFEGLTFLGSCTEPKMQWNMFIEVKNKKTEQTFIYSVFFSTKTE